MRKPAGVDEVAIPTNAIAPLKCCRSATSLTFGCSRVVAGRYNVPYWRAGFRAANTMGRVLGISMVRIRLSELDDAVKTFLARAQQGETIVVEDDDGMLQCGVTPYIQASAAEKKAALDAPGRLQQKSARSMAQLGVAESDIDRELRN